MRATNCPSCGHDDLASGHVQSPNGFYFLPDGEGTGDRVRKGLGRLFGGRTSNVRAVACRRCGRLQLFSPPDAEGASP